MQFQENIPLAPFTTLQIGGPARFFVSVSTEPQLLQALKHAQQRGLRVFVLGGGSNLVVPDSGFDGLVVHATLGDSVTFEPIVGGTLAHADAGLNWDPFVRQLCEQNIAGVECMAGIPGLVGGSPIQNIGAYGQEAAATIRQVTALDRRTRKFVRLSHRDCNFTYRRSIFNSTHRDCYVVTQVTFFFPDHVSPNLSYADLAPLRGTAPSPLDVYHFVRDVRARKGMLIDPTQPQPDSRSAGSFFKNPVVASDLVTRVAGALSLAPSEVPHWPAGGGRVKLPAAWLIERAGFPKGFVQTPDAPVGISSRHTLALINRTGTASCADLLALRDYIIATVEARFGLTLEQEPVTLG